MDNQPLNSQAPQNQSPITETPSNQTQQQPIVYEHGSFWSRLLAFIIDEILLTIFFVILLVVLGLAGIRPGNNVSDLMAGLIFVLYNSLFIWRSGSTIGKKALKLKVVDLNYQSVPYPKALLRESLGKIISSILELGFLWILIDKRKQAWHDKIAGTYVVKLDANGNFKQLSTEPQVSTGQKILFWFLFLFFGFPLLGAVLGTFIYLFIVMPVKISGSSMAPNYTNGQYFLVSKNSYATTSPQRGDVVVFHTPPNNSTESLKRIIGLPGDIIRIQNGQVYINGQPLTEPYLQPNTVTAGGQVLPDNTDVTVPQDQYFVLGDNRPNSTDSREFGFVTRSNILGKISVCYFGCLPNQARITPL